jgi:hypothetical protein
VTEPRCKLHPREDLALVEFTFSERGEVLERERLYICRKCPLYLTERDVITTELQTELAL